MNLVFEAPVTAAQIPVFAVRNDSHAGMVARLIERVLDACGVTVGAASDEGTRVGETWLSHERTPATTLAMLEDPMVEAAVIDGADTRTVLGMAPPDVVVIDADDPSSREDDAILSIVAERVRPGGTLVLAAADARLMSLVALWKAERPPRRIVLFGIDGDTDAIRTHLAWGGTAYVVVDGCIVERQGQASRAMLAVRDYMPIEDGWVEAVLAAVAACRTQGITGETIARAIGHGRLHG